MMKKQKLSFTVGIPTYYGHPSLISTVTSILNSKGVGHFKIIVTIDGRPLQPEIERALKKLNVKVIFNPKRGGQFARINQLIELTETDLLVLTQDDILFEQHTLKKIVESFTRHKHITMVSPRLYPLKAENFLDKALESGVRMLHSIGDKTNNGDNYLLASGRCLAFRAKHAKKLSIPKDVINSDAYLYFENKRKNGKFLALKNAVVYNKSPQTIDEHLKQSKKFQYSKEELTKYVSIVKDEDYKVSPIIALQACALEFSKHPLSTLTYLGIFAYTRLYKNNMFRGKTRFWNTDISTKQL